MTHTRQHENSRVLYKPLILELRIDCLTGVNWTWAYVLAREVLRIDCLTDVNWTGAYVLAREVLRNRFCRRAGYGLGLPSLPVLLVSSAFVRGVLLRVIFI
nr:uncharacterized protein LOC108946572 [Nicotiana tomentosiformis]